MRGVFLCAANPTFFPDLLSDEDHEKDTLEDHEKDTLEDHEKEKYAREASVKRGWNLCGRVRERGAFSVWGDIARKGCHFDGEVSMPTGGSVKAVRTTGEHVASVGGSYGCGEGGERRAVLCECFSLLILPTLLSGRFSTLHSFFRLSMPTGEVSTPYAPPASGVVLRSGSTLRVWAERMGAVREGSGVRCVVNAFRSVFDPSFFL